MTSIASVADTAEEKFVQYYDVFMPSLKDIVEYAVDKELRLLRGKTIECISLIGLAVGKEKVGPRAAPHPGQTSPDRPNQLSDRLRCFKDNE